MADAHPTKTPAEAGPVQIEEEEVLSTQNTALLRSATESLLYLSSRTRPDLGACSYRANAKYVKTRSEGDDLK